MEKQKIKGISNRDDYVKLILKKEETYYPFLFKLLKKLNIEIPDIQDYMGNDPNILEEKDSSMVYGEGLNKIYEVIGCDDIFLFIHTELRKELTNFIQENSEFIQVENTKNKS
jgi:hypothetical protein